MNRKKNYNIENKQSWVYLHLQATPIPICHGATYFFGEVNLLYQKHRTPN